MSRSADRRDFQRALIRRRATILAERGGVELSGALIDLSEGGALVAIDHPLDVVGYVKLSFTVVDTRCETTGNVQRVQCTSQGIWLAIEFGMCGAPFTYFIRNLLAAETPEEHGKLIADLEDITVEIQVRRPGDSLLEIE